MKILFSLLLSFLPAVAGQKLSLETLLQSLPPENEITAAYRKPNLDVIKIRQWKKKTESLWSEFKKQVEGSSGFVRGEIEQEKVLSSLTAFLQLSVLQCRLERQLKEAKPCANWVPLWFRFAGDLAYEEASLVGLRLAPVLRSLWLDELENWGKTSPTALTSVQDWVWQLPAPWPVDRVLLSEGRRLLDAKGAKVLDRLAVDFQKNNYQTADQMLKKIPGPKPAQFDFIKKMWRTEDLEAMKIEINRLNHLRVMSAQARFLESLKKPASSYTELISTKLMTAVPVDYLTGRPMEWVR